MKRLTVLQKIGYLSLLSCMMVFAYNAVSAQSKTPIPPESQAVALALPPVPDMEGTTATEELEAPETPEAPDAPEISIDLNSDDPYQDGSLEAPHALELKAQITALKAQQAALTAEAANLKAMAQASRKSNRTKEQTKEVEELRQVISKLKAEMDKMRRANSGNSFNIEEGKEFKELHGHVRRSLEQASSDLKRNFNSKKMDALASMLSAKALEMDLENKNKNNRKGTSTTDMRQKLEMEFAKMKAKFSEIKQENLLLQKWLEEKKRSNDDSPN